MDPSGAPPRPPCRTARASQSSAFLVSAAPTNLIVERTVDGLAVARARGRMGGPRFKMSPTNMAQARSMYDAGQHTVQQIADTFGVSRPTIYRHLGTALPAPPKAAADTRAVAMS